MRRVRDDNNIMVTGIFVFRIEKKKVKLRQTRLDGICFPTRFLTGNGLEKTSRRRRNGKTGFGVQRREIGREKGGFSSRFPVNFPFFFRPV
jgi:hypothetical protein